MRPSRCLFCFDLYFGTTPNELKEPLVTTDKWGFTIFSWLDTAQTVEEMEGDVTHQFFGLQLSCGWTVNL